MIRIVPENQTTFKTWKMNMSKYFKNPRKNFTK